MQHHLVRLGKSDMIYRVGVYDDKHLQIGSDSHSNPKNGYNEMVRQRDLGVLYTRYIYLV